MIIASILTLMLLALPSSILSETLSFEFTSCKTIIVNTSTGKIEEEISEPPQSIKCDVSTNKTFPCFISFKSQRQANIGEFYFYNNSKSKIISITNRDFINFENKFSYLRSTLADTGEKICVGKKL